MNRPRHAPLSAVGRPAGKPLTALPADEPPTVEPLEPVLLLSDADLVPCNPGAGEPILDALPFIPPLPARPGRQGPILDALPVEPELVLDALPIRERLTPWRLVRAVWRGVGSALEWGFGLATLIVGLAFLAAIPVVGFLSLGYLLEAGGRIARNAARRNALLGSRPRWWITRLFLGGWLALGDGLIGPRKAARVGRVVLGIMLVVLPLQFVSSLYASAQIIDPDGVAAHRWQIALSWLAVVAFVHIALACLHGGKLRYFLWPIGNLIWLVRRVPGGRFYTEPRDGVWDFVGSLRLPYYFWLGARGYFGALAWLFVPITLMALGRVVPLVGVGGAFLFGLLLLVLPFLQMHFAAQNRFGATFDLWGVWKRFLRAPWAFALAQFVALLFSLPLYLFKIEVIQRDVGGIPSLFFVLMSLVFVVFIFPTRLLAGWAYARSELRAERRNFVFWTTAGLAMLPGTMLYVGFVFLTQYISWKGFASLYEQHTFMLPVPF